MITGTEPPAHAVTTSPDGTVEVTVNELSDPAGLEAKLGAVGIKADVTFLAPATRCAAPRFTGVDRAYGGEPAQSASELRSLVDGSRSFKATRVTSVRTIRIFPQYIKPDETLVVEFRDNGNPQVPWQLGAWLAQAGTSVKPCTPVTAAQ
ncbi:hypothetical protein [Nonomuraea sp. NPDC052265]|uniref:hypothetical protein n=1 Tax=Nonomuraea sp. NPDC052265 TaxID=3364374 RepID=UPI0037C8044F